VIEQSQEVAPTEPTILINGETGTGKELVAAAIHECSHRRDQPYVVVDTVALSETLLESELFGHTKGAFTGAVRDKPGLFEAADGGTIFLDEVGEIQPAVQFRLLRAIQEREVRRLGAVQPSKVDVRIIAATQWDLEEAVRSGRLRADLYYRLTVYTIEIPPLRERPEDIALLVEHALTAAGPQGGRPRRCTDLALRTLESYDWPGNVRELLAVLEGARIGGGGKRLAATDVPERVRVAWREKMLSGGESRTRTAIIQALEETDGHRGTAAKVLGVGRTTLWRWLTQYGLR
jgi:two-component system response regulator HydG